VRRFKLKGGQGGPWLFPYVRRPATGSIRYRHSGGEGVVEKNKGVRGGDRVIRQKRGGGSLKACEWRHNLFIRTSGEKKRKG